MKLLEALGYDTFRSAGSHGIWDVIGYNATSMVFVQVKYNDQPTKVEWDAIHDSVVPPNGHKLVHIYKKGTHAPIVLRIA